MPGLNQQGPDGAGMMTGRQRGTCRRTEGQFPAGDGSGRGRGMGMRYGSDQGRCVRQGRRSDTLAEVETRQEKVGRDELKRLKVQYQAAQQTLNMIERKIAALESGD